MRFRGEQYPGPSLRCSTESRVPSPESRYPAKPHEPALRRAASSEQTMTRIATRFAELKAAGRTALIPFVTAGDPLPDAVPQLLHALVEGGADLIEMGMPFSDPMADGPVIQHANERALAQGVRLADVLAWVREFRRRDGDTPIVLMGYLNPVEVYGWQAFADDAVAAGVDGVLLVDCPVEEMAASRALRDAGLDQILLAAPTTSAPRLAQMCEQARGFLYYVSFAGITGAARLSTARIAERVAGIRDTAQVPVAVGFGVRDAGSATAIAGFADGVVIGSALVERLAGADDAGELAMRARDFLGQIGRAHV